MRRERRGGGKKRGQDRMGGEERRREKGRGAVQEEECEIEGTKNNTRYLHAWPKQCHDCV